MEREQEPVELSSVPDPEQRKRFARLMLIRGPLGPSDCEELGAFFPYILRAHRKRVWAQLRKRGLPATEIDDLLQDIFLGLHLSLRNGFPESIAALLYTITRRRVVDHLRTMGKEPYSLGLPSSASEPAPKSPPDPGRALDREGARKWVFSQLTAEEIAIIEAVELDELKHEDAALALGIPLGTFRRHLTQTRKKLKELIRQVQGPGGKAA